MNLKNIIAIGAVAASALVAVAPANAVVTTFAGITAIGTGNVVWQNNGATLGNNQTYTSSGTGGTLFTTASASSVAPRNAAPGAVLVKFSFLNSPISPFVSNVDAMFTLNATTVNSPVQTFSGFKLQQNLAGTFSVTSTTALNSFDGIKPIGSVLIAGSFSNTSIFGAANATSGVNFGGSTSGGSTIDFLTSDFLSFGNTTDRGVSLSLDSIVSLISNINNGLNNANGRSLRSFRATAQGNFSADPLPNVLGSVPEPGTWMMLVAGFGMVGVSARRRQKSVTA